MLPTKFQVKWHLASGGRAKIDFQDGHRSGHLEFLIGPSLAILDLQVTLMLPTKFSYVCSICACLVLSVSSSSWCLGRAVVCDCATSMDFSLTFFLSQLAFWFRRRSEK